VAGVATLVAAAEIAGCGSSDSKSLGDIRDCLTGVKIPYRSTAVSKQFQVPLRGGSGAIPIEVDKSEDEARHEAKSWKDFGAAAGKTGTTVVKGTVWVGYPTSIPASTKSRIEDCAF